MRGIGLERSDGEIITTIIAMARALGLQVLAGRWKPPATGFLQQHGCQYYQGYLFCRPQPAAALAWLAAGHDTC